MFSISIMSLNSFADLLSSPGAASLFDSSAQASSLTSPYNDSLSHRVDLSLVDFDYLTHCTNPTTLHSIIHQLEHEPYPDLLQAARHRLLAVDDGAREAMERRRREGEEKQAMTSELERWIQQQKQKEQAATTGPIDIRTLRQQPPIRSSKPAAADTAEPAVVVAAVSGGKAEGEERPMSEEEKRQRVASEKQKGNECYKAGEYSTAADHYSAAIALLPSPYNTAASSIQPTAFSSSSSSSASAAAGTYDFSLHTNLAMAQLRLAHYSQAVSTASAALLHSHGTAVKAWWRRAQAYQQLNKHAEALRDYTEAIKRAEDGKVKDEMERERRQLLAHIEQAGTRQAEKEEEKRQVVVEEERKEKARADTGATGSERLKRMTIVEADSDDDEEAEAEDEKSSSQPVFQAPRGGMTIELVE